MRRSRSDSAPRSAVSRTEVYCATLPASDEAAESARAVSAPARPVPAPEPQPTTIHPTAAIAAQRVKNAICTPDEVARGGLR